MAIKKSDTEWEDVVKFPGVTDSKGNIVLTGPEYKGLPYTTLVEMAKVLGGRVVSVSYPVKYTMGSIVCSANQCFMTPVDGDRCNEHKLGRKS